MDGGIFLHVCCAPCLAAAMATFRAREGGAFPPVSGIVFYNPNIHPLLEFRRRLKALRVYLERDPLSAEIDDRYGLGVYLARILDRDGQPPERRERCYRCYSLRLEHAAGVAAAAGLPALSTTLLASREQDRDLVAEAGRKAAEKFGLEFVVGNLRRFLPEERMMRGIYKQQYCGCIFSEEERYRDTNKHLYRIDGKVLFKHRIFLATTL